MPAIGQTRQHVQVTKKWEPGYIVVGLHDNGLTYDVRKPGSSKPPEQVHCNRLKPQSDSQVYREGLASARVLRRAQRVDTDGAGSPQASPNSMMPGSGSSCQDGLRDEFESTEPGIPRPVRSSNNQTALDKGLDSGVTHVLEDLGANVPHSRSPGFEDYYLYEEVDSLPTEEESSSSPSEDERRRSPTPAPGPAMRQRPRRIIHPPDRYSP